MKFNKKFLYAGMFSVMLLQSTPAISTVFAADDISVTDNDTQINNNYDNDETYSSKPVYHGSISGNGDYEKSFYISDSYNWYKVWIENTSDHDYTVDITNDSPVGHFVKSFKVKHKSAGYVILQRGNDGDKYVSITSESGYPLSGSVSIRQATRKADLNNDNYNL